MVGLGGIDTPATRIRAIGDYLWPVYEPRNVNSNQASVQVTGVFGFASVPTATASNHSFCPPTVQAL
jgi:hypothetical protein